MAFVHVLTSVFGASIVPIGPGQMCARAVVIFIYGVVATRLGAWRAFGRWAAPDIIVAVIIGSNLSRTLTGPVPLVSGMAATTVFIAAYWLVSFLASRSEAVDWLLKGRPTQLIANGEVNVRALRKAAVSRHDLHEALREKGVAHASNVVSAQLERNGSITVIRKEDMK